MTGRQKVCLLLVTLIDDSFAVMQYGVKDGIMASLCGYGAFIAMVMGTECDVELVSSPCRICDLLMSSVKRSPEEEANGDRKVEL